MTNTVKLTIDDKTYEVPAGMNLVEAAKRYAGVDIPVFCYHPKLGHDGNCRMCLVELATPRKNAQTGEAELAWFPTPQTACTQYVTDGMTIRTTTAKVQDARKEILEFLLSSHPLDCPICDKGGECPLQNLTMRHGPGTSRMYWDDRMRLGKHIPLGEVITLDQERCIHCARCIRFQDRIAGEHVLDFESRGRSQRIITNSTPGFDSIFSGNTTDICPVGALTTADFRFNARPWEMVQVATICSHCPVGCNMSFDTRTDRDAGGRTVIKRVMPRQNEAVNEIWICDKGRFAHHHMDHEQRLRTPLIRKGGQLVESTWEEALEAAAGYLRSAGDRVAVIGGGRLSNEDAYAIQKLVRGLGSDHLAAYPDAAAGGEYASWYGVGAGTDLQQLGQGDAIVVAATDLHETGPVWYLRVRAAALRGASLIVVSGRSTPLDQYAAHTVRCAYGEEAAALSGLQGHPALADAASVVVFVGREGLGPQAAAALAQAAASLLLETGHVGRPNNGLIVVWPSANGQGTSDMGLRPDYRPGYQPAERPGMGYAEILDALAADSLQVLYIAGADPVADDPAAERALRGTKATLIVQDLFLTRTASLADIVLPVQSVGEREGTFTSGERRVQRFYPAIEPVGESLPDWLIAQRLGEKLGQGRPAASAAAVMAEIARTTPLYAEVTYPRLARYVEQFPDVGGDDLYYGGTAFQNRQGLGLQIPAAAESGNAPAVRRPDGGAALQAGRGSLVLVPIPLVYDAEPVFALGAEALSQRIPAPWVRLNPSDAAWLSIQPGDPLSVTFDGRTVEAAAQVDDGVPAGVALIAARLQPQGAPLMATPAQIARLERVGA